jgi:hypothetical protein
MKPKRIYRPSPSGNRMQIPPELIQKIKNSEKKNE